MAPSNKPPAAFSLTPKAAFGLQPEHVELHNNYAASETAQVSLNAALVSMALRLQAADPVARAHNWSKLEGAREFVGIWLNIGRQTVDPEPAPAWDQLKPV